MARPRKRPNRPDPAARELADRIAATLGDRRHPDSAEAIRDLRDLRDR